ncbi:MAG: N-acetylglutaminylglutamine synthetase [Deltaproteobacteria bacterium CG11_big_fil_rev_8_21_14_0_20_45_16]|nr:MAG: N-acetylglutaminylglutamine synthetase [Deltaproteobacteria bacterium CG11_big_fil_rev_8_21_14_0_20_45_16]
MKTKNKTSRQNSEVLKLTRVERVMKTTSQSSWKRPQKAFWDQTLTSASIDCGWGQMLFGHTFESLEGLKDRLCDERVGARNIALYLRDPHVLTSLAPQELFLDPSHTFRIWFENYRPARSSMKHISIRRAECKADIEKINLLLEKRRMVRISEKFNPKDLIGSKLIYFMAEERGTKSCQAVVMGLDHLEIFNDPEKGCSLWSLAVDPHAKWPGIGELMVRHLIEHYMTKGRSYLDLSVMHNNQRAIKLYEKLKFERVPVFCVKNKNAYNEPLYMAPEAGTSLNPYAEIIIREARRRGIGVEILDKQSAIFSLSFGGRTITCQESLTEMTSAIALLRCSHKPTTLKVLKAAGLKVPDQMIVTSKKSAEEFLKKHRGIVVKPAVGEQGNGVAVNIRSISQLHKAIGMAGGFGDSVILERYCKGIDLRIVVIDFVMVAASVRRAPSVVGNAEDTIQSLIAKRNRRLHAATFGESKIPVDYETERCLKNQKLKLSTVLEDGREVIVRLTPNLHTGGSLVDVTDKLHPHLKEVAETAAKALKIPVVGLDLIIDDVQKPEYVFIEANERPGLANHEPQPTADKFIDLLFPQTKIYEAAR